MLQFGDYVSVTNAGVVGECLTATNAGCLAEAGVARFPLLAGAAPHLNPNAYDVVVFVEGVNDIEAGVAAGSVQNVYRTMVANARDRKVVIIMTKFEEANVGSLDSGQVKALGDAIWNVTTDGSLGVEIYRQAFFRTSTSGGYPTQAGYDAMASDILTKLTREFPLQPCDARNDKPGKGCPRNP